MIHSRKDYNRIQDPMGKIGKDEPVILFRAKDSLMIKVLIHYIQLCHQFLPMTSNTKEMIDGLEAHLNRVRQWQDNNAKLVKYPDIPDNAGFIYETWLREQQEAVDPQYHLKLLTEIAFLNTKLKNFSDFNYETAAERISEMNVEVERLKEENSLLEFRIKEAGFKTIGDIKSSAELVEENKALVDEIGTLKGYIDQYRKDLNLL